MNTAFPSVFLFRAAALAYCRRPPWSPRAAADHPPGAARRLHADAVPDVHTPISGPAWSGYGRDAQHTSLSAIAAQDLGRIAWTACGYSATNMRRTACCSAITDRRS